MAVPRLPHAWLLLGLVLVSFLLADVASAQGLGGLAGGISKGDPKSVKAKEMASVCLRRVNTDAGLAQVFGKAKVAQYKKQGPYAASGIKTFGTQVVSGAMYYVDVVVKDKPKKHQYTVRCQVWERVWLPAPQKQIIMSLKQVPPPKPKSVTKTKAATTPQAKTSTKV